MREANYRDRQGRQFLVLLPDGVADEDSRMGLPVGPPPLGHLDLPLEVEVRLNNQLFARGIFTWADAKARRQDIFAAWQAALATDCDRVVMAYLESETAKADNQNGFAPAGAVQEGSNG